MNKIIIELEKIHHSRNARRIEQILIKQKGVHQASVSASGKIRLVWDEDQTDQSLIIRKIRRMGLKIVHIQNDVPHKNDDGPYPFHFKHKNAELYFAIASGFFWSIGLIFSFTASIPQNYATYLFVIGATFGSVFTTSNAVKDLLRGKFEIDFLMIFAAIGAAFLAKWGEAALLLFLFSLGNALEQYAMGRAQKSIAALSDLAPPLAMVKRNGNLIEVPIEDLRVGEIIVVRPNSKIAADGVVSKGTSPVNQASITGESVPVDKRASPNWQSAADINKLLPEHRVFSGTINGNGVLEVKVLKEAKDSTLYRLITLVKEAETQKSPTQHLADKFEKYYVPSVLALVVLLLFAFLIVEETFEDSFYRAMSVLIAASPCALAISTPSAVLAGIARAAHHGVLIKGGRPLEDLGGLSAIAFDKTGTLTEGRPVLTHAIPFGRTDKTLLLSAAIAVEALSDHPLAVAIVEGGKNELGGVDIPMAENLKALVARGIRADWDGDVVHVGNRRLFEELTGHKVPKEIHQKMSELESGGHTAMIVHKGKQYLGIISVMDVARPDAINALSALRELGIKRIIMLTGDNQSVADAIAKNLGITDPMGSLLPEDKVKAIEKLTKEEGSVAMVGDGVNDAPAMAKSTVGIAMGAAGSDVALETADIALMSDKLNVLPFAIGLSRKAKRIIKQNLFISLGMVAVLVPLTITGTVAVGPAVVGHEGSTVVVVLNALRLLKYKV